MAIEQFPPVEYADEHGLLAVGGDLEVESLRLAYSSGIFPWPTSGLREVPWFAPPKRGVLFLQDYSPPRSLVKASRRGGFELRVNTAFREVIASCAMAKNRPGQRGSWITRQMVEAYSQLHGAGFAHSIECFVGGELVGGLYGVGIGGMFAGESMFYREPNASKLALNHLVEILRARGSEWIDCQQLTPFFSSMGAVEIERERFMELLGEAVARDLPPFPSPKSSPS